MKRWIDLAASVLATGLLLMVSGCAIIAVADAAISVTATVVKTGVKVAGAAIDAVIPD
ncbi:MAG: hypothetical protein ACOYNF_09890 [Rhodoferax sp.]|jgi:hypothetical protein|nr:hypothetical protein [Rhodoferax sp.]